MPGFRDEVEGVHYFQVAAGSYLYQDIAAAQQANRQSQKGLHSNLAMLRATLGPYELLECIGSGGMGDVYRARDTRLERTVAIKILRESIISHPDMGSRFEQEARSFATLNDLHVCAIYVVG